MKKKAIALSLAMATMFSSSALAYTVSEPGQLPVVDEVVEYTICAPDTTYVCDLNENTLTPWIQEKTNVKINFEEIPDTEWDTKVNLLIASDELPDAFIYGGFSAAELADYGSQGVFLALNDIIEEHGHYVKQVFDQQEALPGAYTALDGNIYTLPDINECYHCFYSMRAWINQQWLTNLGLEYPNTVDEFVNVLRAFKEQDANGNGDPNDEIPFSGNATSWNSTIYPFLLNSFLHYDTSNLSVKEDGTVIFTPIQPEFKEGLQWIASLIDEGLIEKEALTQTEEQLKTKGSNLDIALLGGFTSATWWSGVGSDNGEGSRCREYSGLSPLEGPNGVRISPWAGTGFNMGNSVITTACEDPVPLFKMLDYMLSDELPCVLRLASWALTTTSLTKAHLASTASPLCTPRSRPATPPAAPPATKPTPLCLTYSRATAPAISVWASRLTTAILRPSGSRSRVCTTSPRPTLLPMPTSI